jgi:hypothetical protein
MDPDLFARFEFGSALKFRIRILSDTWNFLPENIRRKKIIEIYKKLAGTENEIEIRSTALLGEGRKQERVSTMGREAYQRDDYPALVMNQVTFYLRQTLARASKVP